MPALNAVRDAVAASVEVLPDKDFCQVVELAVRFDFPLLAQCLVAPSLLSKRIKSPACVHRMLRCPFYAYRSPVSLPFGRCR